jgi:hypothetical protein
MWFLQLTHRSGTPVILVETEHLAGGLAALLDAAQYDSFRVEPAHLHKNDIIHGGFNRDSVWATPFKH